MSPLASHPPAPAHRRATHAAPVALIDTRELGAAGRLTLRHVLPQDDHLLGDLVAGLSARARRNRFHGAVNLSPARLRQMSCVDHRSQLALVVTTRVNGEERLIADVRYCVDADDDESAEFALLVDERWQGQGVGRWALGALQCAAGQAGLRWLQGDVLCDNRQMLALAQRCGFALSPDPQDDRLVKVQQRLRAVVPLKPRRQPPPSGVLSWIRRVA